MIEERSKAFVQLLSSTTRPAQCFMLLHYILKCMCVACSPVRIEIEYKYIQSHCWIHSKHINMKKVSDLQMSLLPSLILLSLCNQSISM